MRVTPLSYSYPRFLSPFFFFFSLSPSVVASALSRDISATNGRSGHVKGLMSQLHLPTGAKLVIRFAKNHGAFVVDETLLRERLKINSDVYGREKGAVKGLKR